MLRGGGAYTDTPRMVGVLRRSRTITHMATETRTPRSLELGGWFL